LRRWRGRLRCDRSCCRRSGLRLRRRGWNWTRRDDGARLVAIAAAGSRGAAYGLEFFAGEKELTELGHHQSFAAELIFEPRGALRGEDAHGVIDVEPDGEIAGFFGDGDWRGHDERRENVKLCGIGQAHVNTAEI